MFLSLGLSIIVPWVASRIRTNDDLRRAQLIRILAEGTVAELMVRYPGRDFVALLELAVEILSTAIPSFPSKNADVIRRAASDALIKAGVKPIVPVV
jgi:hypothetical protein